MYIALNASSKLTGVVGVGVTTVPVTAGTGTQFAVGSNHSYVTFQDATNKETCKITGQSGDNLTVVRTKALSWSIGTVIECRPCAEAMADYAVAPQIAGSAAKTTPVDADTVGLIDSAASSALKKVTWANIKATLKMYFDTVYQLVAPRADIASATTLNLDATTTHSLNVTGTTATTAITLADGATRILRAAAAWPITHGASLICPGSASYTCSAGDLILAIGEPAGVVRLAIWKADGTAVVASAASGMPRSYLAGLGIANNGSDATNDIDIAVGACRDSTNAADITLPSALTKQLDAAWAVGTNAGGLDTGSIANTTYHVWAIKRSDTGVVDALFSTSATAPTMPANYDYKRRIGSIVRTGAAIKAFTQDGDYFRWTATVLDINDTKTAATSRTLTVPTGVNVHAYGSATLEAAIGTPFWLISDLAASAETPANNAAPLGGGSLNTAIGQQGGFWQCRTNTSAQVRSQVGAAGGSTTIRIATYGWIDSRGRNA